MARPVFILLDVPGREKYPELVREWTAICHGQEGARFYFISHEPSRMPSRWTYAERKRPFIVYDRNWFRWSAHETLDAAVKSARRLAQPKEKQA